MGSMKTGRLMAKVDKREIETKVKQILAEQLDLKIEEVTRHASFRDDLGMDSFGAVEFMFELKEKFKIEIPEKDVIGLKTVDDIVKYLVSRLSKRRAKKGL